MALSGGPVGLLIAGAFAAATAWALFSRRISDTDRELNKLLESAQNLTSSQTGLTEIGGVRQALEAQRAAIEEQIESVLRQNQATRDAGDNLRSYGIQVDDTREDIIGLIAQVKEVDAAIAGLSQTTQANENRIAGITQEFEKLNLAIDDPTRKIREFGRALEDATRQEIAQLNLEQSLIGQTELARTQALITFERENELREERLRIARELDDADSDVRRAQLNVSITRSIEQQFSAGTKARQQAIAQTAEARKVLDQYLVIEESLSRQLQTVEGLAINYDEIRRLAELRRDADIREALSPETTVRVNFELHQQSVDDASNQFITSLRDRLRSAQQQLELGRVFGADRDALSAQFEIRNQAAVTLGNSFRELELAERSLLSTELELEEVRRRNRILGAR